MKLQSTLRPPILMLANNDYDRLMDYSRENERFALQAQREAEKLKALKKATVEMSRTWGNTVEVSI